MEIKYADMDCLKLSQVYLSKKEIDDVCSWFETSLNNFKPICTRDFLSNVNLYIANVRTRTFVVCQHGIKKIPYIYDDDEIVICKSGRCGKIHDSVDVLSEKVIAI